MAGDFQTVLLFRGINVGGKRLLPMAELVEMLHSLGYTGVRSYIQSGNVLLHSAGTMKPDDLAEIGRQIHSSRGFTPLLFALDAASLRAAAASCPFPTDDGKALHLFFLETEPKRPDLSRLAALKSHSEDFRLAGRVFYLYAPEGVARSKLAAGIDKALGVGVTSRNWNTVSNLLAMLD